MGCGTKFASVILLIFTLVFLLIGLALLGGGIWMLVSRDKLFNVLNMVNQKTGSNSDVKDELKRISEQKGVVATAGALLVAAGSVSALISIFGCLGTLRQSKCLLGVYAGIIGGLLALQIAAGVLAVVYKSTAINLARDQLSILQDRYLVSINDILAATKQPETAVSLAFNYMFVSLKCCGVTNATDAALSPSWLKSNRTWIKPGEKMTVPAACCELRDGRTTDLLTESRWEMLREFLKRSDCPLDGEGTYDQNCVDALLAFINRYSTWVMVGCFSIVGVQLLVIIFTACLICSISEKYK